MKKRGQLSVFIVVGIVLIVVFMLFFFFRDKITKTLREEPINPQEYLNQQLDDIKMEIGRCVNQETSKASKLLMENGGVFNRKFGFIRYINISYPVLCREINGTGSCLAEPILISNLQGKLGTYLPEKINKCINLESFKNKDYSLVFRVGNLTAVILDEIIVVDLGFYVKLSKGPYIAEKDSFVYNLNIPLGAFSKLANSLLQVKAGGTEINSLFYELLSFNKYLIQVRKPYPDEVYDISLTSVVFTSKFP